MRKEILLIAIATVLLMAGASAASDWRANNAAGVFIDVNGGHVDQSTAAANMTEDTIQCVPDDGNFTVRIQAAAPFTGIAVTFVGTVGTTIPATYGHDGNNGRLVYLAAGDANFHTNIDGNGVLNVAAPTAEGRYVMCVWDANADSDANSYCENVGVKPDSTKTKYAITNADGNGFCQTDNYAAFDGTITDSTGFGQIENATGQTLDISADIDFDSTIVWASDKKVTVTSSGLVNNPAKLTFLKPNVPEARFEIKKNGSGCSNCTLVESNNGQISFEIASFSSYEVVGISTSAGTGATTGYAFQPASFATGFVNTVQNLDPKMVIVAVGAIALIFIVIKIKKK